jgi:hypothetical protein
MYSSDDHYFAYDSWLGPNYGSAAGGFCRRISSKPVRLLSLTPDEGPRRIVILLDASGS